MYLDNFWNAGDRGIRISPQEQWHFMHRVAHRRLALRPDTFDTALDVFVAERQGDSVLRAKTGLGWRGEPERSTLMGWYVGWVEAEGTGLVPFASVSLGEQLPDVQRPRIDNARRVLREQGLYG